MKRIQNGMLLAVGLLIVSTSALAQDASVADLEGRYAFSASMGLGGAWPNNNSGSQTANRGFTAIGSFVLDGDGSVVNGTRTLFRPLWNTTEPRLGVNVTHEILQQTFTGSYAVNADGTGEMTVTVTPRRDWGINWLTPGQLFRFDEMETITFSSAEGGRLLKMVVEMKASHELRSSLPVVIEDRWLLLVGDAHSAEPLELPAPDPCEIVRLMAPLLPRAGRIPSSHPCFVDPSVPTTTGGPTTTLRPNPTPRLRSLR